MMRSIAREMRRSQGIFKYDKKVRGHHNHCQLNKAKKDKLRMGKSGNGILEAFFNAIFSKSLKKD